MAAVELTFRATEYDLLNRTTRQVVLIGEASLTGLSVGGGPVIPPTQPPSDPPQIWGPTDPRPSNPIPIYPGGSPNPPVPPVSVPPPGSPPVIMPGAHPTHPIVAPAAIFVDYPGIGNVMVPKPLPG